jgi:amino acid adenylation domain-containing protein
MQEAVAQRLAHLSPEQREHLRRLLRARTAKTRSLRRRLPGQRVPLTYGQQRLWFLDQFSPGNAVYNESNSVRLLWDLNVDAFRAAVNEIVRRHESLRMSVGVADGEPCQIFAPLLTIEIPVVDLRQLPAAQRLEEAVRRAAEQSLLPFCLSSPPLLRAALYRLDSRDFLFVFTLHHIIFDGWSVTVLMSELFSLYTSFALGQQPMLPELEIQYGDFAVWQRQALGTGSIEEQMSYWRRQLANLPVVDLPSDRPRPPEITYRGARCPILIAGPEVNDLAAFAEKHGVTVFMLLLTVWSILLHRYTGQDDLPLGSPYGARTHRELESLIGFFVETLVLRIDLAGNPTFEQALARVKGTASAAFSHANVPFERLVEELQPVRDKSRNPLFQVMFQVFQASTATDTADDAAPDVVFEPIDSGIAKFDLCIQMAFLGSELGGHVEYSTELFDRSRIERMIAHFQRLLRSALDRPQTKISELRMLSPEEENQIVRRWNATVAPYPRDSSIPQIFRDQSRLTPQSIAVRFCGRCLSYGELDQVSDRIAHALAARGVRGGDVVGLFMDRALELPAVLLGILKAGAAYVPIDPAYPRPRVRYQIADSGVRVTVTTVARVNELNDSSCELLVAEEAIEGTELKDPFNDVPAATSVAYVIYTSGTTGEPKGVAVTHRNVVKLVKGVKYADFGNAEVVLQFAPITFDASTFEIWGCLLNGGTLVVHPPGLPSVEELAEFVQTERISFLWLTTTLFRQMLQAAAPKLRNVRRLFTGGEVVPVPVARQAWEQLPRTRVVNGYGPTECTTFACTYEISSPEGYGDSVPIGRPIENSTAYVLDGYGNPLPVGVPGELHIGGDGVSLGYWNRPELTQERFVPDRFAGKGTLYRTGDIACYRPDGTISYLGRRDRQVKVSGYRIELGELEACLLRHPAIRAAAAIVEDGDEKRLIAFAEKKEGAAVTPLELKSFVADQLPGYMVPACCELLDSLPVSPNGKVDLRALASRKWGARGENIEFVPPRNVTERALAGIWEELLSVESVGVHDNFFDLGGHSLIATRLLSRIRERFGAQITMKDFFDRPTIGGIASMLEPRNAAGVSARVQA